MSPFGFLRRLFSMVVHYLMRGLSTTEAEQHFENLYGALPPGAFDQARQAAEASIGNVQRFFGLEMDAPLSDVLQGTAPQDPTVNVRAVVQYQRRDGSTYYRTLDTGVDWSSTAGFVYAAIAGRARMIASDYEATVVEIQIVPPMYYA